MGNDILDSGQLCPFSFSDPARFWFTSLIIMRDEGKSEFLRFYFFLEV